jgi:hypothetical protein
MTCLAVWLIVDRAVRRLHAAQSRLMIPTCGLRFARMVPAAAVPRSKNLQQTFKVRRYMTCYREMRTATNV